MSQQELCDNIFGCNSYVEVVHLIFFNGYGLKCLLILCKSGSLKTATEHV